MAPHVSRRVFIGLFGLAAVAFAAWYAQDLPADERPVAWARFALAALAGAAVAPFIRWVDDWAARTGRTSVLDAAPVQLGAIVLGVTASGILVHVLGAGAIMMIEGFVGGLIVMGAAVNGRLSPDD